MEKQNKHWRNKVKHFYVYNFDELEKVLNEFYKNRFVIATQVFPHSDGEKSWIDAIVYYKISPEEQELTSAQEDSVLAREGE